MNDSICNYLLPDYMLRYCMNAYTDEWNSNQLGDIKQIPGYAIVDSAIEADKNILGLHNFLSADGATDRLIATVNDSGDSESRSYYYNSGGSSWDEIGPVPINWTADLKMRFVTFLDYIYAVNGTDAIKSWDGSPSSNWGTTNLTNAPNGSLIANYLDHLRISGNSTYKSRLYSSSIPASDYTISWAGAGVEADRDYIDINPDDNDEITGLMNMGTLLVFKKRGLYTWNGKATEADQVIDIGAVNQEVIKKVRGVTYFFGETKDSGAIFAYSGTYPEEISKPVRKWIDAVATTSYDDMGAIVDDDNYILSIGDVTYEGVSYSNVGLRLNVSNQTWSTIFLPDKPLLSTERIQSDGTRTVIFGNDAGEVHTWNSGNTFNGTAINVIIRTKELEWGSRSMIKTINNFAVYSSAPQGATLQVRVDGKEWITLAKLNKPTQVINCDLHGFYFEFQIIASNSQAPMVFDGFEFYDVKIEPHPV